MSKKENLFRLSLCIPHNIYFHSVVDMFENNNIKVHDLKRTNREGHMIQLEFSQDFIEQNKSDNEKK